MTDATDATLADERLLVISTDCHAGASIETYRQYLDPSWHEEFDAWRGAYSNPFRDLKDDGRTRNWDNERRVSEQAADGVVAEVVFPNTVPPFFPTGAVLARPPRPEEYPSRLAGIRAHNRWLADWCAEYPDRRAGVGQIFLNDLDDAIEDVRFIAENGLRGGLLLPAVPDDASWLEPLFSPVYDRLWAAIQDHDVVINQHAGSGGPDYGKHPASWVVMASEMTFYSRRGLTHLLMGGVFERFPGLRLVLAEQGSDWIGATLGGLDMLHYQMVSGRIGEINIAGEPLPKKPSEYAKTNVWITASFASPREVAKRHALGVDRMMWGSDYPHHEGTYPYTRESLRRSFIDVPLAEVRLMMSQTAAEVYRFDLAKLQAIADEVGPTLGELAEPLTDIPKGTFSPAFYRP